MKVDITETPNAFIVSFENEFGDITNTFFKTNPIAEHLVKAFAKDETEQYEAYKQAVVRS